MNMLNKIFKTKRERILFMATMIVVLGSLLLVWVILPTLDTWMQLSQKVSRKKMELNEVNALLKNSKQIEEEYEKYQSRIRLTDPQKRPEDTLLLLADEIQKSTGVRYTRMDPVLIRKVPRMPGYQSYSLQAVFESDLLTAGRFLQEVQESGLYLEYLQMVPKSKGAHNPPLTVTIRVGKMILKEESAS